MKFFVIDVETSGLSDDAAVVQVGWYVHSDKPWTGSAYVPLPPGVSMTDGAFKVHGISEALLKEKGQDPVKVFSAVAEMMKSAPLIVGHNIVACDVPRLNNEFRRYGLPTFTDYDKVHDTGMAYKAKQAGIKKSPRQSTWDFYRMVGTKRLRIKWNLDLCCGLYKIAGERDKHDAGEDCRMTGLLFMKMADVFKDIGINLEIGE